MRGRERAGLDWTVQGSTGLDWPFAKLDWIGLGWIGLDWTGLDSTGRLQRTTEHRLHMESQAQKKRKEKKSSRGLYNILADYIHNALNSCAN